MSRQLTTNVLRISIGLVFALLLAASRPVDAAAQMAGHNHEPRKTTQPMIVGDQVTSIPYFTLRDGMSSQLTLFNSAPTPTAVTLTIYNPDGKPYSPPAITLDSHSFKIIQLKDVVPGSDFDSGSIEVAFRGITMTIVTTQVSIYSLEKRVLVESRHLHMFMSSKLNGIVWLPDAQADGFLAVTNTGRSKRTIQLAVGPKKTEIVFFGHQSRLIKLNDELGRDASSPSIISVQHDGLPGDVVAGGFVLDLKKGYSATIPMVDPAIMRSSKLAGAHVRFGQPNGREGFPENTRFRAPLLLANLGATPVAAHISVDYTVQGPKLEERAGENVKRRAGAPEPTTDKVSTAAVKDVTLRPGAVELIELSRELSGLGGAVKEAGVDITYDAPPGTVIGQLTNVDESGDYSLEVPLKDATAVDMSMEGGYPWTIENGKNTTIYVKNTTDKPVMAFPIIAFPDGTMYNPPRIDLQPYQTFAIDLRTLKDSKKTDNGGVAFPAGATHGQFVWRQETPNTIIGRAETISVKDGIASSFTCGTGCCDWLSENFSFLPSSYQGVVGATIPMTGRRTVTLCNGYSWYGEDDDPDDTSPDNTGVASGSGSNLVLVGAGTTSVDGDFYGHYYETEYLNGEWSCNYLNLVVPVVAGAAVTVRCNANGEPDDRTVLTQEYFTYSADFVPQCNEFTSSANSEHFSFSALNVRNASHYPNWAILRSYLLTGLENARSNYGSALTITSAGGAYRNAYINASLNPPGAPHSRHIHGDAADIASNSSTWADIRSAAKSANACVEPLSLSGSGHVHMDWRGSCPNSEW